jgi:hypothetical protein
VSQAGSAGGWRRRSLADSLGRRWLILGLRWPGFAGARPNASVVQLAVADMAEPMTAAADAPSDGASMSTPHMRLDTAAMLIARTQSARSSIHRLTPAGHRTNTQHLTELSIKHTGGLGEVATQLAQLKQFNADVTNFIEEVQTDILQEEQRLADYHRSRLASPDPLSGPLLAQRERGGSVPSIRPPAASPVSSLDHPGSPIDRLRASMHADEKQAAIDGDSKRR